jgi:hypothetical protein
MLQLNDLKPDIREEVEKLPPMEQDEVLRLMEKFYRSWERSRRHGAELLGHIANALHDPRGLECANVERIRDWVRSELSAK